MAVSAKPSKHLRGESLAAARQQIFAEESESILVEVEGAPTPPPGLAAAFNKVLPPDLRFLSVELAARNFDPLGECRWKRYCYAFDAETSASLCKSLYWSSLQDEAQAAAALRPTPGGVEDDGEGQDGGGRSTPQTQEVERHLVPEPTDADVPAMNVERMQRAAQLLVGTHDFAAFQAKGGRITTVRTIFNCTVQVEASGRVAIACEGDGFLYKMVRIVAGTLLKIGLGLAEPSSIEEMLRTQDRSLAGPPLPARYLTLERVEYHLDHPLDQRQDGGSLAESVRSRATTLADGTPA